MPVSSVSLPLPLRARCCAGAPSRRLSARLRALEARRAVVRSASSSSPPPDGGDADDDFEARLAKINVGKVKKESTSLRKKQAQTPTGSGSGGASIPKLPEEDLPGEVEFFSGPPSALDLVANLLLVGTILWIPLTLAAIGKYAWLRYRITNKRVTIISSAPVGESGRSDFPYSSMQEVLSIGQGVGLWGDILITNKDGSKLELRSIDKFKDTEKYIREQIEIAKQGKAEVYAPQTSSKPKGFD